MDRSQVGPTARRLRRRLAVGLGVAAYPSGYRPEPGAALRRMLLGLVWVMLGVAQVSAWRTSGVPGLLGLAGLWLALAALHLVRGWRLMQAERRSLTEPD